ncbi:hypothetical protein OB08_07810 [Microbacterium sp. HJ5]
MFDVELTAGEAGKVELAFGLYGAYNDLYDGAKNGALQRVPLSVGSARVTAPMTGPVYLVNKSSSTNALATLDTEADLPTFTLGETDIHEWTTKTSGLAAERFVELVSDKTLTTIRWSTYVDALGAAGSPTLYLEQIDAAVEGTEEVYGFERGSTGASSKSGHLLHMTTPDTYDSPTALAAATEYRMIFPVSTQGARKLLRYSDRWMTDHEIGHTYQSPWLRWDDVTAPRGANLNGEVTVNISASFLRERAGNPPRLLNSADVAKFFARPVDERSYFTTEADFPGEGELNDNFTRLAMWEQLRSAFGPGFYPRLFQELRVEQALGTPAPTRITSVDLFARTAGKVAERDLTQFFREWGIPLTQETRDELAQHPALATEIWRSFTDALPARHDHDVAPYVVPAADVVPGGTVAVPLHQENLTAEQVDPLLVSDPNAAGGPARFESGRVTTKLSTTGVSASPAKVAVVNDTGTRDVVSLATSAHHGHSLIARGIAYSDGTRRLVLSLTIDPDNPGYYRAQGGAWQADRNFKEEFLRLEFLDHEGFAVQSHSIRGTDYSDQLANALDGAEYIEGGYVRVYHANASSALRVYADGIPYPANAENDTDALFRIVDGTFVQVDEVEPVTETRSWDEVESWTGD